MKRTLSLKSERLAELSGEELTNVVGGVPETLNVRCAPSFAVHTCLDCLTRSGC